MDVTCLKSLWNLLSFQRVLLLTEHGQDPFGQLADDFKSEIELKNDENLVDIICLSGRVKNLTNLFHVLNMIYKLIVFKLTLGEQNVEYLEFGIEDFLGSLVEEIAFDNFKQVDLTGFNLKDVKVKNVFQLWKVFVELYFEMKAV